MTIELKLLESSESELLAQAIEQVYGKTYPIPEFYDSAYLRSAIAEEKIQSVVALSKQGEVVGCMSTVLEMRGDYTADGSALMIAPEYRGQGIVARLGEAMGATYRRLGLGGLHLYALVLHDLMQNQIQSAGGVVTGVLPAWFSREAQVSGYPYPDTRIGAVVLYLALGKLPARTCYLPREYAEVLNGLYQRLALPRSLLPAENDTDRPYQTRLDIEEKQANLQCRILLERTGEDFAQVLSQQLADTHSRGIEVVYLDIPLNDLAVDFAVAEARALGFFFGALLVDRRGTDQLRLQRYEEHVAAPEHMVIVSPEAKELLAFIQADSCAISAA